MVLQMYFPGLLELFPAAIFLSILRPKVERDSTRQLDASDTQRAEPRSRSNSGQLFRKHAPPPPDVGTATASTRMGYGSIEYTGSNATES